MAWFEGLSSLKGQLTNLAKNVLNDEHEGYGTEAASSSSSANLDNNTASNDCPEAKDWNDAFLPADFINPAAVPASPWSNEEANQREPELLSNPQPDKSNQNNASDGELASIIPRGLANFFTNVSSPSSDKDGDKKNERAVQTGDEIQGQIRALVDANSILRQQNSRLSSEVASLTRVVEDLESQVAVSQDVNANLSTGLEELDIQHQQAIEQVLVVKDETQKQYEELQTKYRELEDNFEKELKRKLEESQRRDTRDSGAVCETATSQDASTECGDRLPAQSENSVDFIRELEERDNELELVVCENARLREVVNELEEEIGRQTDSLPAIPENSEEIESLELKVSVLENEVSALREARTNLETEATSSRTKIEDLNRRLHISDAMIHNQHCSTQLDEDKVAAKVRAQCQLELQTLRDHYGEVEAAFRSLELESADSLAKLHHELEDKDRRREELERELEHLHTDLVEEHRQHSINLETENVNLKKKIQQLQSQLIKLDEQLHKSENELARRDKKMTELVFESYALQGSGAESRVERHATDSVSSVSDVETQCEDGSFTLLSVASLQNEIKRLQEVISKTESELRLTIKEQELQFQSVVESELSLRQELIDSTNVTESLREEIRDLQSRLDAAAVKNKALETEFVSEKNSLMVELDTLKTISNEFDLCKDIFKQKELEFKNQLQIKDDELTKFKLKLSENEKEFDIKLTELKNNLEAKSSELETMKGVEAKELETHNEASALKVKMKTLQEQLNELTNYRELYIGLLERYDSLMSNSDSKACEAEQRTKELMEEVEELKRKLNDSEESNRHSIQMYESVKEEFLKKIEIERIDYENKIELITKEKNEVEEKLSAMKKEHEENVDEFQNQITKLTKNLQMKIADCRNNQNEIERLNTVLITEKTKYEKVLAEKQQEVSAAEIIAENCEEKLSKSDEIIKSKDKEISCLSQEVGSLKNQLGYASQLLSAVDRQEAEGQPSADANPPNSSECQTCTNGCKESHEELNRVTAALLKEQTDNKLLRNQLEELNEKVVKTTNQLSRLQAHLLSVEENYTAELQTAQAKLTEVQAKLVQADDRARNSSTAYTSANIRANQQVESLNQQLRLLTEHKEKLEAELSKAEDNIQRQNAAVTNLQAVLHQFQQDKQKDVDFETERLRQMLSAQCKKSDDLINEIRHLQDQLNETKKGLAAASRLSEQLDQKTETIAAYRKQVDELMEKLQSEEQKVKAAYSNVEGKVDRNLLKNLLVGYVSSPNNSKLPVLKVLAQVLDLNKEERQKIGLETGVIPQQQQSLSEAFVRFLESESQPKPQVFLPLNQPSSTPPSRKTSQTGSTLLTDTIPNLPHFAVGRNSGSILKDVLKDRNT